MRFGRVDSSRIPGTAPFRPRPTLTRLRPVVLVVEDHDDTRDFVAEVLLLHGARPIVARCADEAIALARANALDVVVTDYAMPGGDGLDVLRRLAEDPVAAAIPKLLVSADADRPRLAAAAAALGASFLGKPFAVDELIDAIARAAKRGASRV